ncbi:lactoylglutathione lyase [Paraburkholderia sp.]|uniref:lactoylglutathione lyase n=1 Tax=Paraburkholderia sp. TaxID=1926495 RepID=UPI0039E4CB07
MRFSHLMLRVGDLQRSLRFYVDLLHMQVLRSTDYPAGKFTNTFIGYGAEASFPTIELTHNWEQPEPYVHGTAFGHIAIEVADVYGFCDYLENAGVRILKAPSPMKHGKRVLAFVEDPDGYKVEISEPYRGE